MSHPLELIVIKTLTLASAGKSGPFQAEVGQLIWKPKRRIGQQGETFSTGGFGKISIKHNERQRRPFGANPKR
jgi:hypothetical protein